MLSKGKTSQNRYLFSALEVTEQSHLTQSYLSGSSEEARQALHSASVTFSLYFLYLLKPTEVKRASTTKAATEVLYLKMCAL